MSRILILDGNNLCHRAFHAMSRMSFNGKGTGAVFGFLNILYGNLTKFKPDKVFVCWDDGRDKNRLKLLPGYKMREPKLGMDYEDFHRQKDVIMKICKSLGIPQLTEKNKEADDFIHALIRKYSKNPKNRLALGSGDKDFRQEVTNKVIINDENKGLITPLNFKKLFEIEPYQYSDFLALTGDSSDKIPGVPGFGEKTALKFLKEWKQVAMYISMCNMDPKHKIKKHDELVKVYERNHKLINLQAFEDNFGKTKLVFYRNRKQPKRNLERYKLLCAKHGIRKFATDEYIEKLP